ncbi:MAG: hypothetical protein Q4C47_00280 [Planctomycetia bacterium]|nr:hypothetical protein [Planctomycetia bacterium]
MAAPLKDLLPAKYQAPKKSELTAEVTRGMDPLEFRLEKNSSGVSIL